MSIKASTRFISYRLGERTTCPQEKKAISQSYLIISAVVFMLILLGYVWSQVNMTKLEYQLAEQYGLRERQIEEQKKLRAELATLKAPKRMEAIARGVLGLSNTEMDQIVFMQRD